jgi:nicotinamide riboside transporter PnuC
VLRLDYVSCVLTVASTILIGRRCWEGWALACVNSVIICIIGLRTAQFGFIPANVFCVVVSVINLYAWRRSRAVEDQPIADLKLTRFATDEFTQR